MNAHAHGHEHGLDPELPFIEGKAWDDGLEFLAGSLYFSDYCVIVNQLGLRFTDESVGCIDEHNAERAARFVEREAGVKIFVDRLGAADNEAAWRDAIARGADGIQTDRPAELIEFLKSVGAFRRGA